MTSVVTVAAAGAPAACGSTAGGAKGDGTGTVKMVLWPGPEGDAMAKVVSAYNNGQGKADKIHVAMTLLSRSDTFAKEATLMGTRSSDFDVYFTSSYLVAQHAPYLQPLQGVNASQYFPLCGALRDLPYEIEEAAFVDGGGTYRTLRSIIFPLLAPAVVAVAVLVFLFSWSDYLFAVILSSSNATPVTVGAANFVTSTGIRWGDISAATFLSVLPPLCFAVFAQRHLVSGLSAGAVKG